MTGPLPYLGSAGEWSSRRVTEQASVVLAPNPGPMTLDGTNTWLIGEPGDGRLILVDPGPDSAEHLAGVLAEAERQDARVALIVLTHGHLDHSEGARTFAAATGAPVRALDPTHQLGEEGLVQGDVVAVGGTALEVVYTPGHTSDSVSLVNAADSSLLTGDTILGRGTTVVAHPDGRLDDYLDSLKRLGDIAERRDLQVVLTGHGPSLGEPAQVIAGYLDHRRRRLDEVAATVRQLQAADVEFGRTANLPLQELAARIVPIVYADVPEAVWPAAALSVLAQLEYLRALPPS